MTENNIEKKVEKIDPNKIKECRWRTGIRDTEKFEQLGINMQAGGLNDPIKIRRIKDDTFEFEVFIGDHRLKKAKELNWSTIDCIIEDIDDKTALEMCIADNICRADFSATEMENWAYAFKQSGRYKSNEEIGNVMGGLSKSRIGQLLIAYEDRKKFNDMLKKEGSLQCLQMGTIVIMDSRGLIDDNERFHLLKLVNEGKIHSKDVKTVCEALNFMGASAKNKILYQGANYYRVIAEYDNEAKKGLQKKKTTTVTFNDTYFTETLYENLTESLHAFLITLNITGDKGSMAFDYLKMSIALMCEELYKCKKIKYEDFQIIRDNILGIYRPTLYGYGGEPLTGGIEKWTGLKKQQPN